MSDKLQNMILPISFNIYFGAQKNRLCETVVYVRRFALVYTTYVWLRYKKKYFSITHSYFEANHIHVMQNWRRMSSNSIRLFKVPMCSSRCLIMLLAFIKFHQASWTDPEGGGDKESGPAPTYFYPSIKIRLSCTPGWYFLGSKLFIRTP